MLSQVRVKGFWSHIARSESVNSIQDNDCAILLHPISQGILNETWQIRFASLRRSDGSVFVG